MRLKREVAGLLTLVQVVVWALVLSLSLLFLWVELATAIMLVFYDSTSGIDEAGGL